MIPCIGFEVEYDGKWLFFSGDTFYDPEILNKLYTEKKLFREGRFNMLTYRDMTKYDIILHEAGVPPVHTPLRVLQQYPQEIKDKLYLVHISDKDCRDVLDVKKAKVGIENTIIIKSRSYEHNDMRNLELLSSMDLFNEIPLRRIHDLLKCIKTEDFKKGEVVLNTGESWQDLFIVKCGIIKLKYEEVCDTK